MRVGIGVVLVALLLFFGISAAADDRTVPLSLADSITRSPIRGTALQGLLASIDADTRLLDIKLAIDRIVEPGVDEAAVHRRIDELVKAVRTNTPPGLGVEMRVGILLDVLGRPGHWNQTSPLRYDMADPFGERHPVYLLSSYLDRRLGNCVSMPILVAILGQELGLDLRLAVAPEHLLVRFRNSEGRWVNIEATSHGVKSDLAYQKELGITDVALAKGTFLRELDHREAAGAMLVTLMDHYKKRRLPLQRMQIADVVLALDATSVAAMLGKGAAYYALMRERYMDRYANTQLIPAQHHEDFRILADGNRFWFGRAESLGWKEPPSSAAPSSGGVP